jgi:hypothetical protein
METLLYNQTQWVRPKECAKSAMFALKEELVKQGRSQKALSQFSGISESNLSKYLNGKRIPTLITYIHLRNCIFGYGN